MACEYVANYLFNKSAYDRIPIQDRRSVLLVIVCTLP
jgi:hypothetical protein